MDTLTHGLWANVVYQRQRAAGRRWAIFFGVAPDLISFGPMMVGRLLANLPLARPNVLDIPIYVSVVYNYTHSMVIWLIVFGLITLWRAGKIWWPLTAWLLHITIDIATHTTEFFPTPFLFPLSAWKISAFKWADPTFMLVNYSLLILAYLVMYRHWIKSKFSARGAAPAGGQGSNWDRKS